VSSLLPPLHPISTSLIKIMKGLLELHEDYIRRVVPPERLFFFNVKDGWEPLCKILNCPVPDEPFPRANDAKAMEFFRGVVRKAAVRWLKIFAISGVAVGVAFWSWWPA
jgi:hypothetical protein